MKKGTGALAVFSLILVGLISGLAAQTTEYPEELEFLADLEVPDHYYMEGFITLMDSTGAPLTHSPVRFYWEKGIYALDVRSAGGAPTVYLKGMGDTIWLYDFMHGLKVTAFTEQDISWITQLPFEAGDLPALFNLFPGGFVKVDTFYVEDSLVVARKGGLNYVFDPESELMRSVARGNFKITLHDFAPSSMGMWPRRMEINRPLLSMQASGARITLTEVSFKRRRGRNPLDVDEPFTMQREFDLRGIESEPDSG